MQDEDEFHVDQGRSAFVLDVKVLFWFELEGSPGDFDSLCAEKLFAQFRISKLFKKNTRFTMGTRF